MNRLPVSDIIKSDEIKYLEKNILVYFFVIKSENG